jgi:hypothetical protein
MDALRIGDHVASDGKRRDPPGRDDLECGQCWRVLLRKSQMEATVKVLGFDERTVVLREIHNIDLIARFDYADVEFRERIDQ